MREYPRYGSLLKTQALMDEVTEYWIFLRLKFLNE